MEVTPLTTLQEKQMIATVQRFPSTKILMTYNGGPDADQNIELQTTVITKIGSVNIQ